MKSKHLLWLLLLIPALALVGCEGDQGPAGPAGPAGADGADGADGSDGADGTSVAVCMDCHAESDDLQIYLEYAQAKDIAEVLTKGMQNIERVESSDGKAAPVLIGSMGV